jgi:hypothetical protein
VDEPQRTSRGAVISIPSHFASASTDAAAAAAFACYTDWQMTGAQRQSWSIDHIPSPATPACLNGKMQPELWSSVNSIHQTQGGKVTIRTLFFCFNSSSRARLPSRVWGKVYGWEERGGRVVNVWPTPISSAVSMKGHHDRGMRRSRPGSVMRLIPCSRLQLGRTQATHPADEEEGGGGHGRRE